MISLGLLSVVMLLLFSFFLLGLWLYARSLQAARQKELEEIRMRKNEVRRLRERGVQQATRALAHSPTQRQPPDDFYDVQRRGRPPVDASTPMLHSASSRVDRLSDESPLLQ